MSPLPKELHFSVVGTLNVPIIFSSDVELALSGLKTLIAQLGLFFLIDALIDFRNSLSPFLQ